MQRGGRICAKYYNNMDAQDLIRFELKKHLLVKSQSQLAKETGVSRSALSSFLNRKRVIKKRAASKYFKKIIPEEKWAQIERRFYFPTQTLDFPVIPVHRIEDGKVVMTEDEYQVHANPLHLAVIKLFDLEDFKASPQWMAKELGLSKKEVIVILERLSRIGVLEKEGSFYRRLDYKLGLSNGVKNPAYDEREKDLIGYLKKASQYPKNQYYMLDFVFTLNPDDIPEFKKYITDLALRFNDKQNNSSPKKLYSFMISLVPMSK